MITESEKKLICPIDGKEKTVYLRSVIHGTQKITQSNGCNDLSGHSKCQECCKKEFKISELTLFSDTPKP